MKKKFEDLPVLICDYMATGEGSTIIIKFNMRGDVDSLKKDVPVYLLMGSVIIPIKNLLTNGQYSSIVKAHTPIFHNIISRGEYLPGNMEIDYMFHSNYF